MKNTLQELWANKSAFRKFYVSLAGALVVIAGQGLLPERISTWVVVIGSLFTSGAVYQVRNEGVLPVDVKAEELLTGELTVDQDAVDEDVQRGK